MKNVLRPKIYIQHFLNFREDFRKYIYIFFFVAKDLFISFFNIQRTLLCVGTTRLRIEPWSSGGSGVFFLILVRGPISFSSIITWPAARQHCKFLHQSALLSNHTGVNASQWEDNSLYTVQCTGYSHCSPIWARTWAHTMINSNQAYSKVLSRTCFSHLAQTCAGVLARPGFLE